VAVRSWSWGRSLLHARDHRLCGHYHLRELPRLRYPPRLLPAGSPFIRDRPKRQNL